MDAKFKLPPKSKQLLTSPQMLVQLLTPLIGQPFQLTYKTRTDGSNVRKLIASTLSNGPLPQAALKNTFTIMPPRGKGVPKILLEYLDTYIVTTGKAYNLQVWNRNPNSESVQIQYDVNNKLLSNEVRFILVKIDPLNSIIQSIAIVTPEYIVNKFGKFGKPTIKSQLIISSKVRQSIISSPGSILFYSESIPTGNVKNVNNLHNFRIHDAPTLNSLLPLSTIRNILCSKLLGQIIPPAATKSRGQVLEGMVAIALGYNVKDGDLLAGGYPDIRNQALEVKIQDSPTVDLGLYSPEFEEEIPGCNGFTTRNTRYLIAMTNPVSYKIEGLVICEGSKLGLNFTYVADQSYKVQRSIPMAFFNSIAGTCVFNP